MTQQEFDKLFKDALTDIIINYNIHKDSKTPLRIGQTTFNVLSKMFNKYDENYFIDICGTTAVDPFYNDINTKRFIIETFKHFKTLLTK